MIVFRKKNRISMQQEQKAIVKEQPENFKKIVRVLNMEQPY